MRSILLFDLHFLFTIVPIFHCLMGVCLFGYINTPSFQLLKCNFFSINVDCYSPIKFCVCECLTWSSMVFICKWTSCWTNMTLWVCNSSSNIMSHLPCYFCSLYVGIVSSHSAHVWLSACLLRVCQKWKRFRDWKRVAQSLFQPPPSNL